MSRFFSRTSARILLSFDVRRSLSNWSYFHHFVF